MTSGVASRPRHVSDSERVWLALGAVVLLVLGLAPPLTTWARHYEFVEALQFSVFAMVVPALRRVARPGGSCAWRARRHRGRSGHGPPGGGAPAPPEFVRAFIPWLLFVAAIVAWRTPAAVDGVTRHFWLLVAEAASSPSSASCSGSNSSSHPRSFPGRRGHGACASSVLDVGRVGLAYTEAMSNTSWYSTFHHSAGHGLGASADHQVSTIVIWLVAAAAFMPVIFWNLYFWLRNDEDPDDELFRLMKEERRRAWQVPRPSAAIRRLEGRYERGGVGRTGRSGREIAAPSTLSAPLICASACERSWAAWRSRLARSLSAVLSEGWLISVWMSSMMPSASPVDHRVTAPTRALRCLPAVDPGTSMLDRS